MKESFDVTTIRILYEHNKKYIFSIIAFLMSVIILIQAVFPLVQDYQEGKRQEEILKQKISVLKQNITLLASLSEATLDTELDVASSALPLDKDYAGIFSAVSSASGDSGVAVADYGFEVGSLSTGSAAIGIAALPSVSIGLNVTGDVQRTKLFLRTLANRLPISEVSAIQINSNAASLATDFYYRPVSVIKFDENTLLQPMSEKNRTLLSTLSLWKKSIPENQAIAPSGSPSANTSL